MTKKIWRVDYDSSDRMVTMKLYVLAGSCEAAAHIGAEKARKAEKGATITVVGAEYVGDLTK